MGRRAGWLCIFAGTKTCLGNLAGSIDDTANRLFRATISTPGLVHMLTVPIVQTLTLFYLPSPIDALDIRSHHYPNPSCKGIML